MYPGFARRRVACRAVRRGGGEQPLPSPASPSSSSSSDIESSRSSLMIASVSESSSGSCSACSAKKSLLGREPPAAEILAAAFLSAAAAVLARSAARRVVRSLARCAAPAARSSSPTFAVRSMSAPVRSAAASFSASIWCTSRAISNSTSPSAPSTSLSSSHLSTVLCTWCSSMSSSSPVDGLPSPLMGSDPRPKRSPRYTHVGKCSSISCRTTPMGALMKSSISSPTAAASRDSTASPVDCRPITTLMPSATAAVAFAAVASTLPAISIERKKRMCAPQKSV
mmetsp:Transcript_18593/g.57751  ORF Transcript_18593/g.57751 Transcript_18593/m.57751 type:complete len:283 (+) Transcript_18593:191-1039(+)